MEPNGKPLDHWAHALEGDKRALVSSFASHFGIWTML